MQLRHVAYRQSEKNLLNSNTSFTCPHNMVNFGPLTAETGWLVWGTPANFNGVRVLALLQRRRSTEINETLHDVWLSDGLVYYIYFRGLLPRNEILSGAKFILHPSLAFSCLAAILHGTGAVGVIQTLRHATRNGIMELSFLIIFNRGPHSSSYDYFVFWFKSPRCWSYDRKGSFSVDIVRSALCCAAV